MRDYQRSKKVVRGLHTYGDAQKYAEGLGQLLADALGADFDGVDEAELASVLRVVMKKAYGDATTAAANVQQQMTRKQGLRIGTLVPEFEPERADKVAEALAGKIVDQGLVDNLMKQHTLGGVDDTIRKNAEANSEMGLETHIVREYSDVGLRAGTKYSEDCQWCLERCGEWDNVADAQAAGAFERHPGCLCVIDYQVGRTHTTSSGGGWVNV